MHSTGSSHWCENVDSQLSGAEKTSQRGDSYQIRQECTRCQHQPTPTDFVPSSSSKCLSMPSQLGWEGGAGERRAGETLSSLKKPKIPQASISMQISSRFNPLLLQ